MVRFACGFIMFFELWAKPRSSDPVTQTFKLFSLHWFYRHIVVPMLPWDGPRRPPDGFQIVYMRPQDAPRNPPDDIREACAFLAPRGRLAGHVPNHEWCVLLWFQRLF